MKSKTGVSGLSVDLDSLRASSATAQNLNLTVKLNAKLSFSKRVNTADHLMLQSNLVVHSV